jgi:hypothetical protein
MSQVCNGAMAFADPTLEQLKNHEIEVGSAAFSRAFAASMLLVAAVETQDDQQYTELAEQMLSHLQQARMHYWRVLSLVEEARARPEYVEWLKNLDYNRLHEEYVSANLLPNEREIWDSVVAPNKERGDAREAYRTAFLDRFEDLIECVETLSRTLHKGSPYDGVSMVPRAFWELQTRFSNTLLAGQAIAVINALKPEF